MYIFELKYWWTFKEVFEEQTGVTVSPSPWIELNSKGFADLFDSSDYAQVPIWSDNTLLGYVKDMFKIVYTRHYDDFIFSTDADDITEDNEYTGIYNFKSHFLTRIMETYDKYYSLLKFYATHKANLMNKIGSSSTGVAKFNDTPQNTTNGFDDDNHVTNITQTEGTSETDGMPLIERLQQIEDKYQNVLYNWAREFDGLFIEGENITL